MSGEITDLTFTLGDDENNKRQAYRAAIPGLVLLVPGRKTGYAVKDLSATGIAFESGESGSFHMDEIHEPCRLYLGKDLFLGDLCIKVVHVLASGFVGCTFENLREQQEIALDKLILEVQKQLITQRKRQEG